MPDPLLNDDTLDTEKVLDNLLASKTTTEPKPEPDPAPAPEPDKNPEPKPDPAPEPDKVVEPAPTPTPTEPKQPESIDDIQLPAHARGSTAKAFEDLKTKAKAQIEELQAKLNTAPKPETVAELEQIRQEKAKIEAELAELRQFRETVAAQGDPIFESKFDAPIKALEEEMYAKLRTVPGYTKEIEDQIKAHGGFGAIDLEQLAKTGTALRRFFDVKLARIDELSEGKNKALQNASESRKQFLEQEKAKQAEEAKASSVRRTSLYEKFSSGIEKFKQMPITEKMSAEDRTRAETYNKWLANQMAEGRKYGTGQLTEEQQAELGVVYTLAHVLSSENASLQAERTALQKQVAELTAKVSSFKGASSTIRKDPRPAGDVTPPVSPVASASDALTARFGR